MTSISSKILNSLSKNNKNIIGTKQNKKWKWYTSNDIINRYYECKYILNTYNFKQNERVVYKGKNSFEFIAWNLAVNSLGGIWVPVYHNQNNEYLDYILNDCNPKIYVSDDNSECNNIISIDSKYALKNDINTCSLENNISTLIYTSGTTGNPKGVMLSDVNIMSNIDGLNKRFAEFETKNLKTLNILPWAHIYSITTELYYNLLNTNQIAISSGPENFVKELFQVKPNILYLVPKVLELIKSKLEKLDLPILKHLIPIILKRLFGNDFITIFVGGAKLDDSTFRFYKDNNINICLGYGCSETSPMVSVNHLENPRNEESVGKLIDDVIVKVVNDEILVSGPNVMKGYWNNDTATKEVLVNYNQRKFYKTGDSGYVKDGFLFLTGRISENYKMSNGKFVNVSFVESKIKSSLNGNFIIFGENKSYNILVTDISMNKIELMKLCNMNIESYLKIEDVLFIKPELFKNYLTPKMSIKRKKLLKDFMKEIEELY